MTTPNLARLKPEFETPLRNLWETWRAQGADEDSSPFTDMSHVPDLDMAPGFNHLAGWLLGVSEATGWSLDDPEKRPGPKDWNPKGRGR